MVASPCYKSLAGVSLNLALCPTRNIGCHLSLYPLLPSQPLPLCLNSPGKLQALEPTLKGLCKSLYLTSPELTGLAQVVSHLEKELHKLRIA